jgi:phage baseplate assembly protein V
MTRHSSYLTDRDALRTMLRRASVKAVNDQGSQQLVNLAGLAGDQPVDVPTVALFGFSSNPPAGGVGLIVCPGGRSDRALFLGGESAKYRPKNQPVGGTTLYDAFGQAISLVQNNIRIVGTGAVTITAPSGCTINGNVTVQGNVAASGVISAAGA